MEKTQVDRGYHHGDLRQSIIEAACQHLRESGAVTLSLRALARDVGVSQTAPYRHFDSKSALFAAIAVYGFTLLEIELQRAYKKHSSDVESALLEVGLAYINWALLHPEKYQLFFDSSLVDFSEFQELIEVGEKNFDIIAKLIEQGMAEGVIIDKPVELVAGAMWASMHGVASLLISKSHVEMPDMESPVLNVINQLKEDSRSTLEIFLRGIKVS